MVEEVLPKYPTLNGTYEMVHQLGEGATAKVYLANCITDQKQYAIKVMRSEFLKED